MIIVHGATYTYLFVVGLNNHKEGKDIMNKLLAKLIPLILATISPEIKTLMGDFIMSLDAKAKATSNPWDDMFVAILKEIISTD